MAKERKNRRDQDLRDAISLLPSARGMAGTKFMPHDPDMQNSLGDELIAWSKKEDSDDIDDFFSDKYIGAGKFYKACQTNQYLDECLDVALAIIGKKIKARVKTTHDYNMKMLAHYSSLHKQERKEKMEADKNTTVTTIYKEEAIHIPVFGRKGKKKE